MRAVRKHTDCHWVVLYMARWRKAPVQVADGTLASREQGTPPGAVLSPRLAHLFLHYALDTWMQRHSPHLPFERFADDAIGHGASEAQAQEFWAALARRLADCGVALHPQKTQIVSCKDDDRRGTYPEEPFDFLG
jgi:RNA-directed DNA polymerase